VLPASLAGSFFFTILVNSSRIIISIATQNYTSSILHEAIGIITNLTFLVLTCLLLDRFLTRRHRCEKTS
jgi:exosortase K